MFDVLVSSRVTRQWRPGRAFGVASAHGMVIAGVIHATTPPPPMPPSPQVDTTIFELREPAAPLRERAPGLPSSGAPEVAAPPDVEVPTTLPDGIPPVVLGPTVDPEAFRRALAADPAGPPGDERDVPSGALEATLVDEPATVVRQPEPRYPPVLKQAGREGRVVVEFVIDTTGHVEPATARILESTYRGFEAAALEALQKSLFDPARMRGRAVRQRTRQAIVFRIAPE